ncbi:hypothetical protein O6H91_05G089700 [Diphasiastrum complanatum]|uniref:Uncharacterized protein n=3 Tax=Diphasiastrum complanatum TaxID=34168 RepID=A0ACC2DQW5_DIPCM|nr:hypothetical protein O6H91_05G089700 [Diphasiastrum complanatum]
MLQIAAITAAVLLFITSIAALWRKNCNSVQINKLHGAQVPKGNWSLPWIGESLTFYNQGPYQFYSQHIARYGRTFRTHLMGNPTIVMSTPEAAKFLLTTQQKSFLVFMPPSVSRLMGFRSTYKQEAMAAKMNKTIHESLHFELVRNKVAKVDRIARWVLSSWEKQPCVVTYEETKKFAFHVALDFIAGMAPSPETMKMMDDYSYIVKAMETFMQFNIPGTSYHKALEKRQKVLESSLHIVKKRRLEQSKEKCPLDLLMELEDDNGDKISDDLLQVQLFQFMFGAFHSTSVLFVWILKFLGENQLILQQVKAEQDTLRIGKTSPEDPLSWTDIVNMPLTSRVIQETLRIANIAPFMTRQATEDINYNGIWIPKGWCVQLGLHYLHLSPEYHKDPLKFDPSRFQAPEKPVTFLPFGSGVTMCPGRELAKMEALVFLHYLVTTYSWENIGSEKGIKYFPTSSLKGGLPIKISKLSEYVI